MIGKIEGGREENEKMKETLKRMESDEETNVKYSSIAKKNKQMKK